jgi:hypothetical protein
MARNGFVVSFLFLCGLTALVIARASPQNRTFILTGHPGELPVVEIGGRSYVEIEALTRLANGSVSFTGNQIVLTLPSQEPGTAVNSISDQSTTGFSKDFLKAAIEEMSVIREWRSALINAGRQIYPVTEDWVEPFRADARKNLRLVSLATSTDSDRKALQLLTNEFNNMKKLSDKFVDATRSRTYIAPRELDNDPLDQKIIKCAHSLAAMASSNQFTDDSSCH